MGKKVFLIDIGRCSGCYNCQFACKDEHCGNDWTPYAKPQPDTGHFWLKVNEHSQGSQPKLKLHYIPQLCNHCDNPACMAACDCGAISRTEDNDFVIIEPEKCSGCGKCVSACPYEAIYFNEEYGIAQKCTGCAHLLDNGWEKPRCVEVCPTDALRFGDEEDFADELKDAVVMQPETGCGPRVYYKNIPGRFIGGTVYDPMEEDVLEGAVVTLSGDVQAETVTDGFGDFWFKNLPKGRFSVEIRAEGFEAKRFEADTTDNAVNLGDIPLDKK